MRNHWKSTMITLTGLLALVASSGCAVHIPGEFVTTTFPVDDIGRVNVASEEVFGESCQWWFQYNLPVVGSGELPLPVRGHQNYLAVERALGDEYAGMMGVTTDHEAKFFGLSWPVILRLTPVCLQLRGKPFVFTAPPKGM